MIQWTQVPYRTDLRQPGQSNKDTLLVVESSSQYRQVGHSNPATPVLSRNVMPNILKEVKFVC